MRFLHTSDWHLGRHLHGHSLLEDQAHALRQAVQIAVAEEVDAFIIAGDVYDKASPPADAVELLDEILSALVLRARIPTILIAGNHDSPQRIGFGTSIFEQQALHVRGSLEHFEPIVFEDAHGAVAFHALPYVEPIFARTTLNVEGLATHQDATAYLVDKLLAQRHPGHRNVLIAHAFVAGGIECDSERPLTVGGSGSVSAATFDGFDYVALGHLHRPQNVASPRLRYSGSLLKYSVEEAHHIKSLSIVDLDQRGIPTVRECRLTPLRDVRIVRGTLAELLSRTDDGLDSTDYICAELTDVDPVLDPMSRLRQVYPNMLEIRLSLPRPAASRESASGDHHARSHEQTFCNFYNEIFGRPPDPDELSVFNDAAMRALSSLRDRA